MKAEIAPQLKRLEEAAGAAVMDREESVGFSDDLSVDNHEQLLSLADGHLYAAKRAGHNRVCGQVLPLSPA